MIASVHERPMKAKKSLGQHFLASDRIARRIADSLELAPGELVFEIGPGRGALTVPLARSGARVVAYEIDAALAELVGRRCADLPNVEIRHADIRTIDFDAAAAELGEDAFKIAGNIPYNITSTILIDLARWQGVARAVLMVQREVGERILASPGERKCGILSIFLQSYFIIKQLLRVRPGSFAPPPKVESVVIEFTPDASRRGPADKEVFLAFLKGCFSQRRKKLRNILGELLGLETAKDWERLSVLSGVDFGLRPEKLALDGWFRLFDAAEHMKRSL
jgi:16S rRNA (adenine1518-N6/adenine1519-N6)-dimethyltransferase